MLNGLFGSAYATPDKANGKCFAASCRLIKRLRKLGIDARLVSCQDFLGGTSGWHHWYYDNGFIDENGDLIEETGHWMVKVGDAYVDLTARQFFPEADYPQVYREEDLDSMWSDWREDEYLPKGSG